MALKGCEGTAWDLFGSKILPKGTTIPLSPTAETGVINNWNQGGFMGYNTIIPINFDGEKDLGEMGPIRKYLIDHSALRQRSWQLYLDSDVCQALFGRSAMWGIGTGLKLQAEPIMELLNGEKIEFDVEAFNTQAEARFKVFANSDLCDFSGRRNLHEIMKDAWINKDVGGDVLIVMRLVDGIPKVELIDGAQIKTPLTGETNIGTDIINPTTKNIIKNGIEQDSSGRHIAYYVQKVKDGQAFDEFERIEVRMSKFPYSQMACLVYGLKYRLANNRGIPLISAIMETAAKMGRYREATLGSAEERAKIYLAIEHEKGTGEEHPFLAQAAAAYGSGALPGQQDLPADSFGNNLSNKVQATTNKQTVNMPEGASLKPLDSKQELNFADFYKTNFDIVCAVAGYPPEVILSKYDSNYSASRAAIKDFEHTLTVNRENFARQTYQIVYNFCLDVWVLSDSIDAPGYRECLLKRNEIALAAYRSAEWLGDTVPHIDPFKEVQAIRAMLGEDSANFPLITMEQAVEMLPGKGNQKAVVEQYSKEMKDGLSKGIEKVLPKGATVEPKEADEPKKKEG